MTKQQLEQMLREELKNVYGPDAEFRKGQLEAIMAVLSGKRTLVVQKTGWGKSLVYFMAIKTLRKYGRGPALIVSPLLALMKNQIESSERFGLKIATFNSDNRNDWSRQYSMFDQYDAFIVSPERLGNPEFMNHIYALGDLSLLVVDEAHSISEWGHDFRPDYQRIVRVVQGLPESTAILATTATATRTVIDDIRDQLGDDLVVSRGDLRRENIGIQIIQNLQPYKKIASMVTVLNSPQLRHSQGVVYCLTRRDCEQVASMLNQFGVLASAYYSGDRKNAKQILEDFEAQKFRVLVSTCKLGMGYDNYDIDFVIHYQKPKNLVAYYQEIGRAGRTGQQAYAILYAGKEDDKINEYFMKGDAADVENVNQIYEMCQDGTTQTAILKTLNLKSKQVQEILKYLEANEYIFMRKERGVNVYRKNLMKNFDPVKEAQYRKDLLKARKDDYKLVNAFVESHDCSMSFLMRVLGDEHPSACKICANCTRRELLPYKPDLALDASVRARIEKSWGRIAPRKQDPTHRRLVYTYEPGWVLTDYYYSDLGQKIKSWKYDHLSYDSFQDLQKELVCRSAALLKSLAKGVLPEIDVVLPVPSQNHPDLVPGFARGLAGQLGLRFGKDVIRKTKEGKYQKHLANSHQQEQNIKDTIAINPAYKRWLQGKTILLVDDMVDSRWTFTVIACMLLEAGAKKVYPCALVNTGSMD